MAAPGSQGSSCSVATPPRRPAGRSRARPASTPLRECPPGARTSSPMPTHTGGVRQQRRDREALLRGAGHPVQRRQGVVHQRTRVVPAVPREGSGEHRVAAEVPDVQLDEGLIAEGRVRLAAYPRNQQRDDAGHHRQQYERQRQGKGMTDRGQPIPEALTAIEAAGASGAGGVGHDGHQVTKVSRRPPAAWGQASGSVSMPTSVSTRRSWGRRSCRRPGRRPR